MGDDADDGASRHLGLDLGGTNLKWAVVEHAAGAWSMVERDSAPTPPRAPTHQPTHKIIAPGELGIESFTGPLIEPLP